MKTAIAYYSMHHGNTKKLLDAIVAADPSVVLMKYTEVRYALKKLEGEGRIRMEGKCWMAA